MYGLNKKKLPPLWTIHDCPEATRNQNATIDRDVEHIQACNTAPDNITIIDTPSIQL